MSACMSASYTHADVHIPLIFSSFFLLHYSQIPFSNSVSNLFNTCVVVAGSGLERSGGNLKQLLSLRDERLT